MPRQSNNSRLYNEGKKVNAISMHCIVNEVTNLEHAAADSSNWEGLKMINSDRNV
jgi:hypothetical protein